jgi:hypothetical protein
MTFLKVILPMVRSVKCHRRGDMSGIVLGQGGGISLGAATRNLSSIIRSSEQCYGYACQP